MTGFDWTYRRRWLFMVTFFTMGVIGYCLWEGTDSRLYETAITASFTLLGALGGSYIFGAAWEHRSIAKQEST